MTARAVASVSVDWQIEAQPGVDLATLSAAVGADPAIDTSKVVNFAATTGLEATHGASTQTTGAGQVVGLPDGYRDTFPAEIRDLAGAVQRGAAVPADRRQPRRRARRHGDDRLGPVSTRSR